MKTIKLTAKNFKKHTLRADYGGRGGGIEIDLTSFGFKGQKMSAYQNYLGGGMLGKICSSNTINRETIIAEVSIQEQLDEVTVELKKYFHSLTNHSEDEFENQSFEQNQLMSVSAY